MLGVVLLSKVPYSMITLELVEMKMQLKEMLDKGYSKPNESFFGSTSIVCQEYRWYSQVMHRLYIIKQDDHQEKISTSQDIWPLRSVERGHNVF
jgi:hypothetical protein